MVVGANRARFKRIRETTLENLSAAVVTGNQGDRPKVIDDDMLLFARGIQIGWETGEFA